MQNEFKGFSLFNDVEDAELRAQNRGRVMANMAEDHSDKRTRKVNPKGASLILSYFSRIVEADRNTAKDKFKTEMEARGFVLTA
jgi:hypothetical protein